MLTFKFHLETWLVETRYLYHVIFFNDVNCVGNEVSKKMFWFKTLLVKIDFKWFFHALRFYSSCLKSNISSFNPSRYTFQTLTLTQILNILRNAQTFLGLRHRILGLHKTFQLPSGYRLFSLKSSGHFHTYHFIYLTKLFINTSMSC